MSAQTPIHCLLLCAGLGSRMQGPNKLHLDLNGRSILETTLINIFLSPFTSVTAITGFESEKTSKVLKKFAVKILHNESYKSGMHSTIKKGIESLSGPGFAMICLSDQPLVTEAEYQKLIQAAHDNPDAKLIAPTYQNRRGNPVLISLALRSFILAHPDSDKGCSYLFQDFPNDIISVPMDGDSTLVDLDTPEDYQCLMTSTRLSKR